MRKNVDERFKNSEYLKYDIICSECGNTPIECKCEDKWFRLSMFHTRVLFANVSVAIGSASKKEHRLFRKIYKYI